MNLGSNFKILVTEVLPYFQEESKILGDFAQIKIAEELSEDYLALEAEDADVIITVYAKITRRIIEAGKKLKGIVRCGIGVDNIDLDAATQKRVLVANVPDYCIDAVADFTLALILALSRRILHAHHLMKTRNWGVWTQPSEKLRGFDIKGKTCGIIGLGRIGKAVAERIKGFGAKIIAYDPYLDKQTAWAMGVELTDLNNLLRNSDFVCIHAPLTHETRGLIGENELRLMKKTAYLINTARGPIIQEEALYKALAQGWIAGAALDVYEKEPISSSNPILDLENVILTPHIAWYTEEALRKLVKSAVEETLRILKGEIPRNLVNKQVLTKS